MKCGACGKAVRKGSGTRMNVMRPSGELAQAVVCVACKRRSTLVVTATASPCSGCGSHAAQWCDACLERISAGTGREALAALRRGLKAGAEAVDAQKDEYSRGYAAGLLQASKFATPKATS